MDFSREIEPVGDYLSIYLPYLIYLSSISVSIYMYLYLTITQYKMPL